MNKYIDADKLVTIIEERKAQQDQWINRYHDAINQGIFEELTEILSIIESLQQEQSFPRWIHANYSDKPEIRYSPSGVPYLQSGSYMIWLSDLETLPKDGTDLTNPGSEQPETNMKSPFTGGKVAIQLREEEVTFRGEKVKILRKYYRCEDTGREFTDSKLDDDMMWAVFRAYCEKKGMTSFNDIMLKQEQPEVDWNEELPPMTDDEVLGVCICDQFGNHRMTRKDVREIARHFYELGLNARKEE